ncbi:MAG: 50S ribosomal protein L9 [bacterium]
MKVFMLKDVEKVGMAGQVIKVADGYARNYLFPNKLAVIADGKNTAFFEKRIEKQTINAQVLNSKAAMLAERIKTLHVMVKERAHDDGKLYGAVGAEEIVNLLKEKGIVINKKQVEFEKSIKSVGEYKVTIKLSSKLKPQLTLKVVEQ